MGLIIKIKNIQSPNNFKLFIKEGRTPGSSSEQLSGDWGVQYGNVYSSSINEIVIDLIDEVIDLNPYGKQYWFKILDVETESFIIENIYIHEKQFYDSICATPTPTPTQTLTPTVNADCTFNGGSAIVEVIVEPTLTPTITPTLSQTITPTVTPTFTPGPPTPTQTLTPTFTITVTPTNTPNCNFEVTASFVEPTPIPTQTITPTFTPNCNFEVTTSELNLT
jgi:hypothetical protein